MFDKYSDGYCPQCMLDNKMVSMMLNLDDLWECPECRLQAHNCSAFFIAIMRKRGKGELKRHKATDHVRGIILTRAAADDQFGVDSSGFGDENDLRVYLNKEVDTLSFREEK